MKNILIELILAFLIFLFVKLIIVLLYKFVWKLLGETKEGFDTFEIFSSCALLFVFVVIWFASMPAVDKVLGMTDIEFYISFCMIGIFCVIWCYFSWGMLHIMVKPRLATDKEKRIKKIVIYSLIFLFVISQGYQQALHSMDANYEVNVLFSVTNYSVIVALIALDRVMNQIFPNGKSK